MCIVLISYVIGCTVYATAVLGGVCWFCRAYIPSDAEKAM